MNKKAKKNLFLIIVLFLLCLVTTCDKINFSNYIVIKSQKLLDFVDEKNEENYSSIGRVEVYKATADYMMAIANASTKSEVTIAYRYYKSYRKVRGRGHALLIRLCFRQLMVNMRTNTTYRLLLL